MWKEKNTLSKITTTDEVFNTTTPVEQSLKFLDRCLVWDNDNPSGKFERLYVGSYDGKHFTFSITTETIDEFRKQMYYDLTVIMWDNVEPYPTKKKMTLEQIQEALGYEIELEIENDNGR
jgi:hypothetical protein